MSSGPPRILDLLLQIREGRQRSSFLPFVGEPNVYVLWGFVLGAEAARLKWDEPDAEYVRFRNWLRDEKNEWPTEGWHVRYLALTAGEHFAAMMLFLDRAAEFRARTAAR